VLDVSKPPVTSTRPSESRVAWWLDLPTSSLPTERIRPFGAGGGGGGGGSELTSVRKYETKSSSISSPVTAKTSEISTLYCVLRR
jgi:hypothetical protein